MGIPAPITFGSGDTTGTTTADLYSDWIPTNGAYEVHFHVEMANTGTPAGSWYLQGKTGDVTNPTDIPIATVSTPAAAAGVTHTADATAIACSGDSGNGTSVFSFAIAGPPGAVRLFWDRTSGGAANAASGFVMVKRDK